MGRARPLGLCRGSAAGERSMTNVAVVGAQWGDEGKGKIVDWLSERAEVVVRFQGGHNAGHTLVIDGRTYKLSLLPSGVVRPGKISIIGNGVVIDPWALLAEIDALRAEGVAVGPDCLRIAENDLLAGRIDELLLHHNALRAGFGEPRIDGADLVARLNALAPRLLPYAEPVWQRLAELRRRGARILFEGAQGAMLDVDHGTYPFVTSSNTLAAAAALGAGTGPDAVGYVLGITKAYTTRVGSGPFPTELDDEIGRGLGERGREFGTVTGRARRCGWFDAVLVRQTVRTSGINGLALTKLDILDGFDEIKVCIGYRLDGRQIDYLPAGERAQAEVQPVYETIAGWKDATAGARSWADLPAQAIKYVRRVEELVGCPVALLSTSPEREDTILMKNPFES